MHTQSDTHSHTHAFTHLTCNCSQKMLLTDVFHLQCSWCLKLVKSQYRSTRNIFIPSSSCRHRYRVMILFSMVPHPITFLSHLPLIHALVHARLNLSHLKVPVVLTYQIGLAQCLPPFKRCICCFMRSQRAW